jgi:hypothetical protein
MPDQLTNVGEIKEIGILLKASREHKIRILGAFKTVTPKHFTVSKEDIANTFTSDVNSQYHSGSIKGTQEDPEVSPLFPRSPSLVVNDSQEAEFLKRDVT